MENSVKDIFNSIISVTKKLRISKKYMNKVNELELVNENKYNFLIKMAQNNKKVNSENNVVYEKIILMALLHTSHFYENNIYPINCLTEIKFLRNNIASIMDTPNDLPDLSLDYSDIFKTRNVELVEEMKDYSKNKNLDKLSIIGNTLFNILHNLLQCSTLDYLYNENMKINEE